ncbi:MAG: hypothetical protein QOF78_2450 [Phycisphaerales bacterium]|nr:hypothetical protein [Phycisphaerales bacterium]
MPTHLLLSVLSHAAAVQQPLNWTVGWGLVLLAFISGSLLGIGWHRDDFLGGYASFRRRVIRLGHVAFAALGLMNVVFSLSPLSAAGTTAARLASAFFIAGGVLMPLICFLTGWRPQCRHLFFLPVVSLVLAVVFTLLGARS